MAQYFFDSSAAVKYYHAEAGTEAVSAIFAQPGRKVRISSLGFVEIQAAFAMKVRSGVLDRTAAGMQRARLLLDLAAGDIEVYGLTADHLASAERLIGRHAFTYRLRTLDALQLTSMLKPCWTTSLWRIRRSAQLRRLRACTSSIPSPHSKRAFNRQERSR